MKKLRTLLMVTAALAVSTAAYAIPSNNALQNVLNSITVAPTAGVSSVNTFTDFKAEGLDSNWYIAGGSSTSTMIVEIAGFAPQNRFGIYDTNDLTKTLQLFNGADTAGASAVLTKSGTTFTVGASSATFSGNSFGFYILSPEGTFYSDTTNNSDGLDHMLAYQGQGDSIQLPLALSSVVWGAQDYILAFEDRLVAFSDLDYNDMVVLVQNVDTVPEPGTLALLGAGLIAIPFIRRKVKK